MVVDLVREVSVAISKVVPSGTLVAVLGANLFQGKVEVQAKLAARQREHQRISAECEIAGLPDREYISRGLGTGPGYGLDSMEVLPLDLFSPLGQLRRVARELLLPLGGLLLGNSSVPSESPYAGETVQFREHDRIGMEYFIPAPAAGPDLGQGPMKPAQPKSLLWASKNPYYFGLSWLPDLSSQILWQLREVRQSGGVASVWHNWGHHLGLCSERVCLQGHLEGHWACWVNTSSKLWCSPGHCEEFQSQYAKGIVSH